MRIAYFNANLKVGQDGVTRCVYKMVEGVVERGHKAIAITSTLPIGETQIPVYGVPSVVLPLQKNYRIALPGYQSFARHLQECANLPPDPGGVQKPRAQFPANIAGYAGYPWTRYGARCRRFCHALASSSPTICWATGSQTSFRFSRIEIFVK